MVREDIQGSLIMCIYLIPEVFSITIKEIRFTVLCLYTNTREQDKILLAANKRREVEGSKSCPQLPQRQYVCIGLCQ